MRTKREAEAGLPGGSRDLLSLQGGHAGNDTSAHPHYTKDCGRIQGGKTLVCSRAFRSREDALPPGGFLVEAINLCLFLFLRKILSKTRVASLHG